MANDALSGVEGPRTIRYFVNLLLIAISLYVIGIMLSQFYGFSLLVQLMGGVVDNPMALMDLAGLLALFGLVATLLRYARNL